MNTRIDRRQLAIDLCTRSTCFVKMASVISDQIGIFAWGWNAMGPYGLGTHAEDHAISRANRKRLHGSTITVAGFRRGRYVLSRPCVRCYPLIVRMKIKTIEYIHPNGVWSVIKL